MAVLGGCVHSLACQKFGAENRIWLRRNCVATVREPGNPYVPHTALPYCWLGIRIVPRLVGGNTPRTSAAGHQPRQKLTLRLGRKTPVNDT